MKKNNVAFVTFFLFVIAIKSEAQWNLTGNANATGTSILGTTNAIPLNLTTNNVSRLIIDANGRIGIGIATPVNILTVRGSGGTPAAAWVNSGAPLFAGFGEQTTGNADYILSMASSLAGGRPVFIGRRSKGTLAAPAVVANNDFLMSFLASGFDGTAFQNPAAIDFFVDGTPAAGNVPTRISFVTGSNSANRAERLKIGNTGDITINTNQLFVQRSTGNVGIGTTSPSAKLDVLGNIKIKDGTQGLGKVLTSDASGLATWQLPLADSQWVSNGTNIFNNNSGNVGIGTIAPTKKLEVNGDALINGLTAGRGVGNDTSNTSFGFKALGANKPAGLLNTAIGSRALFSNTTGSGNTANGTSALANNTTGGNNTANGVFVLTRNTTGHNNTASGFETLFPNTTGFFNTAYGAAAMSRNTTGSYNTANGGAALFFNTTGSSNTANGLGALLSNTTGYSNVAVGIRALHENTTVSNLVAVGDSALYQNGSGSTQNYEGVNNTAVGSKALYANTLGYANTAVGYRSISSNVLGNYNTALGSSTLAANVSGYSNVAIGSAALFGNTSGYKNVGIGDGSLAANNSFGNTGVGSNTLFANTTGSNNTAIGYNADVSTGALTNTTVIGYNATVNASNKMQLGSSTTTLASTGGITIVSDGRFKDNVKAEDVPGLEFINNLNPVAYNFNYKGFDDFLRKDIKKKDNSVSTTPAFQQQLKAKSQIREVGLIAQEVNNLVLDKGYTFNGVYTPQNANDNYALDYSRFVVPLVKAVQELSKKNEELGITNEELKKAKAEQAAINALQSAVNAAQQKQIDDLKALMQQLLNTKSSAPCPPLVGK